MTFSERAVEAAVEAIIDCHDKLPHHAAYKDYIAWEGEDSEQGEFAREWMAARRLEAHAALTAALAVDGMALVPKEPTEDMLDFGACYEDPDGLYQNHSIFKDGDISRDVYRAMVEAASREFLLQPPAASEGEERDSTPQDKP